MAAELKIDYKGEPTINRFHRDDSFVRGIMGPIGSGKSVGCCIEIVRRAIEQKPGRGGVRRSRWAVIRNTYPELKSTTIKTWSEWFPANICPITWASPITGKLKFRHPDGSIVDLEVLFIALDLDKDVKKLLSLELTGAWINEARELQKQIIDTVTSRVGRYPAKRWGGPSWSGIIMDTNPPDDIHWWYKAAEEDRPKGWRFFRQPAALIETEGGYEPNPSAENVKNQPLGYDYWIRQIGGKDSQWISVYLLGEYGTVMSGKPVYLNAWKDREHVSDAEMKPIEHYEIVAGWDFGLMPAMILVQLTPRGFFTVIEELCGEWIGVRQFAQEFALPLLRTKYVSNSIVHVGDPAGSNRAEHDARSAFDELQSAGIRIQPAPTNNPAKRWDAVRWWLGRRLGADPVFQLSPACKRLRKGFNGGYRFRKLQVQATEVERYSEQAEKNLYSHPHDALQYIALYLRQRYDIYRPTANVRSSEPEPVADY